jgi:hypothetical protein
MTTLDMVYLLIKSSPASIRRSRQLLLLNHRIFLNLEVGGAEICLYNQGYPRVNVHQLLNGWIAPLKRQKQPRKSGRFSIRNCAASQPGNQGD